MPRKKEKSKRKVSAEQDMKKAIEYVKFGHYGFKKAANYVIFLEPVASRSHVSEVSCEQ